MYSLYNMKQIKIGIRNNTKEVLEDMWINKENIIIFHIKVEKM